MEVDVADVVDDEGRRSARRFCAPSRYDPAREASKPQWDTGEMTTVGEPRISDTAAVAHLVVEGRRWKRKSPASRSSAVCFECNKDVPIKRPSRAGATSTTKAFRCAECVKKARTKICVECNKDVVLDRPSQAINFRCSGCSKKAKTVRCVKCNKDVALGRSSQAIGAGGYRCSNCSKKAKTVRCVECNKDMVLNRSSRATGAGGYRCSNCSKKAKTVRCVECNKDVVLDRSSRAIGAGGYRCSNCSGFECPVCGNIVDDPHTRSQDRYARYEACSSCKEASGVDIIGGDLLKLAQTSPASIVGAARLAQYAHELRSGNRLTDDKCYAALLERSYTAIQQHMHVQDEEKVALAEAYENSMQYEGNCCAVCGVRDVEAEYVEMYFSVAGDRLPGPAFLKTTKLVQAHASIAFLKPAQNKEQRKELRKPFKIPESTRRVLWLPALPEWLSVPEKKVKAWRRNQRKVYVENDDESGLFVQVELSALDLRHVMCIRHTCDRDKCQSGLDSNCKHVHLVEEAVASKSGVALMFVCASCSDSFPCGESPCKGPPMNSMAKRDYGRRYLSATAVDRLRSHVRGVRQRARGTDESNRDGPSGVTLPPDDLLQLLKLRPSGWRLPIASRMETMLLANTYTHIMSLKVAEIAKGKATHATLSKHTVYFPQSLMDADRTRQVKPWQEEGDATDALRIAVQKIHLVFVGSDGKFDQKKRALLSMQQMALRPKVVFTLLAIQSMTLQEQGTARTHTLELAQLEQELSWDMLAALITPESVSVPPKDQNKAVVARDHDHAFVRSDRGCANRGCDRVNDSSVDDSRSSCAGQRHPLPHEKQAELEEEPIAGTTDISSTERDVMLGAARLLQRGSLPIDDYGGQPQALYDAHFPLFPTQEGLELGKKLSVRKTRHMALFYDCRFAQDLSLMFELADTLSRHSVNSAVQFSARNSPYAQKQLEVLMQDDTLPAVLRRACQDPRGDEAVALLHKVMPFVRMSARRTPYTDGSRGAFLGTLFAHHRCMGPSNRTFSPPSTPCYAYQLLITRR